MSHAQERARKNCLNCNAQVHGRFCQICGQENLEPQESFWHLVTHFFNDITHFDGKFFSSLKLLFFHPGFLSAEYKRGRRSSYLNPVRMYVFTSFLFFLVFFSVYHFENLFGEGKPKPDVIAAIAGADSSHYSNFTLAVKSMDSAQAASFSRAISKGQVFPKKDLLAQVEKLRLAHKSRFPNTQPLKVISRLDSSDRHYFFAEVNSWDSNMPVSYTHLDVYKRQGLTSVIRSKEWQHTNKMSSGLAVNYMEGMSNNVDLFVTLAGSFVKYPVPNRVSTGQQKLLLEASAAANIKLLPDNYWVSPYITLGIGASKYSGYYGAFLPTGLGLQIKLLDDTYFMLNTQYRIPVTENVAYHFYHAFGIAQSFGKAPAPVVEVPALPVVLDRDNDGVADENDKCPDVPGLANLMGCPDRDGDGIADGDDKCPDKAGTAKYGGCPVPDTDGDGINDEMDKCPNEKGVARYQGCPVPDKDGDGVNDEEDKCPDLSLIHI